MPLPLDEIKDSLRRGVTTTQLAIGALEEFCAGQAEFGFGGIVIGELDPVIDCVAASLLCMCVKSVDHGRAVKYDWQKSNLEPFCVRFQALRQDGLLMGGYIGRLASSEYGALGFGLPPGIDRADRLCSLPSAHVELRGFRGPKEAEDLVRALVRAIRRPAPILFISPLDWSVKDEVRAIGTRLHDVGQRVDDEAGMELMQAAHMEIISQFGTSCGRELEAAWHEIGDWRF